MMSLPNYTGFRRGTESSGQAQSWPIPFGFRVSTYPPRAYNPEVTICDFKIGTGRTSQTAVGVHGAGRRHASSVLGSPTAVCVNIEIMRAFVRLRRLLATPGELVEQLTKLAKTVQLHDE